MYVLRSLRRGQNEASEDGGGAGAFDRTEPERRRPDVAIQVCNVHMYCVLFSIFVQRTNGPLLIMQTIFVSVHVIHQRDTAEILA